MTALQEPDLDGALDRLLREDALSLRKIEVASALTVCREMNSRWPISG